MQEQKFAKIVRKVINMTWKDDIKKDDRKKFRELQKDADILADYLEDLDKMETRIVDSIVDLREIREELPQFKDYVNKMLKSYFFS